MLTGSFRLTVVKYYEMYPLYDGLRPEDTVSCATSISQMSKTIDAGQLPETTLGDLLLLVIILCMACA